MTPREVLMTVLSEQDADDVIEHRRVTIKKPLTTRAAQIMVREMQAYGDPAKAVETMIAKCWRGFEASWMRNQPRSNNRLDAAQNLISRITNEPSRDDLRHSGDYGHVQLIPSAARH